MSHDRFMDIRTRLHVNNIENCEPTGQPGYDPIYKICPVLSKLIIIVPRIVPQEILTVDEAMCAF
jgi:hypothetical protein